MKFLVLGAYGKSGQRIIREAVSRGHKVIGIAHHQHDEINLGEAKIEIKDVLAITKEDLTNVDAIIDAISAWTPETFPVHSKVISHIAPMINGTDTQYIKIGGAGTIYINQDHTQKLKDWNEYPTELQPLAAALNENLARIRSYSNILWTYATPAFNYDVESDKPKPYQIKFESMELKDLLNSHISYNNMARALVDIAEDKLYTRQRIILLDK